MCVGMIIVPMTMLIEIILVKFFQVVLILVDLGRAMGMAMRAVALSMFTVLSHRASAYIRFRFSTFELPPSAQPITSMCCCAPGRSVSLRIDRMQPEEQRA